MLARISHTANRSLQGAIVSQPNRGFSYNEYNKMAIPLQKLKFIEHPRYGPVYPVVCLNRKHEWPNAARNGTALLTAFNGLVTYSTFYMPIFTAEFSAIVAHPLVLLPSLLINYYLYKRHYSLFYLDRSLLTSMYLMPCGRKITVETRDGDSKEVVIGDIFMKKHMTSRYEEKFEF